MARAAERDLFAALARRAGAHGVYVGNDLAADNDGRSLATRGLAFLGRAGARALAWFGPRGNLIVVQAPDAPLDVHLAARAIVDVLFDWRIALGPEPVLAALAQA